jgi:multidrug transporter EmrE-like cation transporter
MDFFDVFVKSINWKIGHFSVLPIFIGTLMAFIDILMMGLSKMISLKEVSTRFIPVAMLLYGIQPLLFLKGIRYDGMVITNLVWNLISNVVITIIGVAVFGETLKGIRWIGIGMGLVSLALLAYSEN